MGHLSMPESRGTLRQMSSQIIQNNFTFLSTCLQHMKFTSILGSRCMYITQLDSFLKPFPFTLTSLPGCSTGQLSDSWNTKMNKLHKTLWKHQCHLSPLQVELKQFLLQKLKSKQNLTFILSFLGKNCNFTVNEWKLFNTEECQHLPISNKATVQAWPSVNMASFTGETAGKQNNCKCQNFATQTLILIENVLFQRVSVTSSVKTALLRQSMNLN